MKQWVLNVAIVFAMFGVIGALCLTHADELKPQEKVGIEQPGTWVITTTTGIKHHGTIRTIPDGLFVVTKQGETFIHNNSIKKCKQTEGLVNGGKNRTDVGRDILRNVGD